MGIKDIISDAAVAHSRSDYTKMDHQHNDSTRIPTKVLPKEILAYDVVSERKKCFYLFRPVRFVVTDKLYSLRTIYPFQDMTDGSSTR